MWSKPLFTAAIDYLIGIGRWRKQACRTYAVDFHGDVIEIAPQVDRPKYGLPSLDNVESIPHQRILHQSHRLENTAKLNVQNTYIRFSKQYI